LAKSGIGSWTLGGNNLHTGSTTLNAGTLKLNYDTGAGGTNSSKLSDTATTGTLLLNGGTLELSGGSHLETVLSTTLTAGTSFVKQTGGTSTLSMGAIIFTSGAIDFSVGSIATTSSTVTNGILSQRATVAGAHFAMESGSNIVAYDYLTSGSTDYTGGAMDADTNYAMQTAGAANTLDEGMIGATSNTLKIANTATGSLAVDANTLVVGAILFSGSANYDITTSGGNITSSILHNYGTGGAVLNLGALGTTLTQFGNGTTVLNNAATTNSTLAINGGTVQISDNLQIGTNTTANLAITLNNGTLLASETLALNNAGLNSRTFTLGAGGGTLAAANTKTLTVSGVISGTGNPLIVGSGGSDGTVTLSAVNTYTGGTRIDAGTLALGNATNTLANTGAVAVNGGTLSIDANSDTVGAVTLISGSITGSGGSLTGASYDVRSGSAAAILGGTNAALTKTTNGTVTLSGTNSYTGATTVSAGILSLGSTGSVASSSSVAIAAGASFDTSGQAIYAIPTGKPLAFGIDATGSGSSGKITAAQLDITNATVTYNINGTPDDPAYVLATYTTLTGGTFLSAPTPPAGYTLDYAYEGNQIALVAGAAPYDTWAAGPFTNPFTNTLPGVDFDNDGLSNLLEFVLGGDPTISQAGIAPAVTTSGGNLVMTFKRSDASELAPAVSVKVELSTDLSFSTPADDITIGPVTDAGPLAPSNASYTVTNSGGFDTIVLTLPQGAAPKKFARVKAVQP
jgi:autotransporter-associated beta strand protein